MPKKLIIKDCARRFVLKLYRHEASRGLFATAELFVHYLSGKYHTTTWQRRLQTKCFMGLGIHGPGIQGGSRREVLGGLTSIVRISSEIRRMLWYRFVVK